MELKNWMRLIIKKCNAFSFHDLWYKSHTVYTVGDHKMQGNWSFIETLKRRCMGAVCGGGTKQWVDLGTKDEA